MKKKNTDKYFFVRHSEVDVSSTFLTIFAQGDDVIELARYIQFYLVWLD